MEDIEGWREGIEADGHVRHQDLDAGECSGAEPVLLKRPARVARPSRMSPVGAAVVDLERASKQTLARFGRPGRQAGEFTALHGIAADRQGNLYTAEVQTGQRIQKFRRVDRQE